MDVRFGGPSFQLMNVAKASFAKEWCRTVETYLGAQKMNLIWDITSTFPEKCSPKKADEFPFDKYTVQLVAQPPRGPFCFGKKTTCWTNQP